MDKEKLKKYAGYAGRYAGYAGLGFVGGLLFSMFMGEYFIRDLLRSILIVGAVGGLLGGVIAKKEWGAVVGGFVLTGLIVLIVLFLFWLVIRVLSGGI